MEPERPVHLVLGTPMYGWTFLSSHALVLLCIARDPAVRIREIADAVGITERAAQRLVTDLLDAGYLVRTRTGRRNHYEVVLHQRLRHPLEQQYDVAGLLAAMQTDGTVHQLATA